MSHRQRKNGNSVREIKIRIHISVTSIIWHYFHFPFFHIHIWMFRSVKWFFSLRFIASVHLSVVKWSKWSAHPMDVDDVPVRSFWPLKNRLRTMRAKFYFYSFMFWCCHYISMRMAFFIQFCHCLSYFRSFRFVFVLGSLHSARSKHQFK